MKQNMAKGKSKYFSLVGYYLLSSGDGVLILSMSMCFIQDNGWRRGARKQARCKYLVDICYICDKNINILAISTLRL